MKSRKQSMDGFVTGRPQRASLGEISSKKTTTIGRVSDTQDKPRALSNIQGNVQRPASAANKLKQNISESLAAIDESTKPSHRQERKQKRKKKLIVRVILAIIGIIIAIVAGWLLLKVWQTMHSVFGNGNIFDLFSQQKLKEDSYGRSNVLILGTTDDDPDHPGATLTDSMMVLSVNQTKKDAYMFSIPRDLYVKFGMACNSGYAGKINEYFGCVNNSNSPEAETERMDKTKKFIGDIFGMDIQYVAHINTAVIRDAVNAVGGVTVNVQSRDPRGILDPSMDWMCRAKELNAQQRRARCPTGHYMQLTNGSHEMDGEKAMWFSRARGLVAPTYGLEQSNFDREKNQQLVLMALKSKATSTGTLTNFGKVTSLMDAMGKNLRTNIDTKEIRTIMNLASEIKESDIHRLSFVESDNTLMTTGTAGGASIVQPAAGLYDYSDIRAYIKSEIYSTPLSKEKATVVVLNGSGISGAAQKEADRLSELGLKVVHVGNAPGNEKSTKTRVYQLPAGKEKSATKSKFEEMYGSVSSDSPKYNLSVDAQFIVVVGSGS